MKKNIALCLYGFIGSPFCKNIERKDNEKNINLLMLELSYLHLKKYIIDVNPQFNFDIFLHCWNTNIKKELIEIFKPKKYIIIEPINMDSIVKVNHNKIKNNFSRMLNNKMVVNLVDDYVKEKNIKYKQVILSRYDIAYLNNFNISKYLTKDFKIFDFQNNILEYSDKILNRINKNEIMIIKEKENKIPCLLKYKKFKINEILFMSTYKNIKTFVNYYDKLLNIYCNNKFINKNLNNINKISNTLTSPHIIYANILIDMKNKNNKMKIIKIKEMYTTIFNEILDLDMYSNINLLLIKQLYFRNPGINLKFGTLKGKMNGRLVKVKDIFKKYNINEEIIKLCI